MSWRLVGFLAVAIVVALATYLTQPFRQWAGEQETIQEAVRMPRSLAIYYGYPSLVNGAGGVTRRAVDVFASYDVVVFGDGLEFGPEAGSERAAHADHANARAVIAALRSSRQPPTMYGYITVGRSQQLPVEEIRRRTDLWAAMGAHGIFLDEAGYDFGVSRQRLNDVIDVVHEAGLKVFVNAYNPDDIFSPARAVLPDGGGNPSGDTVRLRRGDAYLLESFQIKDGQYENADEWFDRTQRAVRYRAATGVEIYAVTTTGPGPFDPRKLEYAWWSAVLWSLDGFGWGEPSFSADSSLPWRPRPALTPLAPGERFVSEVQRSQAGYVRDTASHRLTLDTMNRNMLVQSR